MQTDAPRRYMAAALSGWIVLVCIALIKATVLMGFRYAMTLLAGR